jgi:heme/copper-type cytochrome/quinol oxidase subunit 2
MVPVDENPKYRLLDVDNKLVLPSNVDLRILVTSADVIHS